MRQKELRTLVLFAFMLVFSVLLISGGQRLIGSEAEIVQPACEQVAPAYLCSAAASVWPMHGEELSVRQQGMRKWETACISDHVYVSLRQAPHADANGNVIEKRSYMRSVYQTFALGDGFV